MSDKLTQIIDRLNNKYKHKKFNKSFIPNLAKGLLDLYNNPNITEQQFELSYKVFAPMFIEGSRNAVEFSWEQDKVLEKQLNSNNALLLMENFIRWGYADKKVQNPQKNYMQYRKIVQNIFCSDNPKINKDFLKIIGNYDIKNYSESSIDFILTIKEPIINQFNSNKTNLDKFLSIISQSNINLKSVSNNIRCLMKYDNDVIEKLFTETIQIKNENNHIHTKTVGGNFTWVSNDDKVNKKIIKALLNNTNNIHQYVNVHDMNKHSIAVWHELIKKTKDNIVDLAFYAKHTRHNKVFAEWIPKYQQYLDFVDELNNNYPNLNQTVIKRAAIALCDNMPENDSVLNILSYHLVNKNWKPEILYSEEWKEVEKLWSNEEVLFTTKHKNFDDVMEIAKIYDRPEKLLKCQQEYEAQINNSFKRMLNKL